MKEIAYSLLVVLYLFSFQYKFAHPFFSTGLFPVIVAFSLHGWSLHRVLSLKPALNSISLGSFFLFSVMIFASSIFHVGNAYSFGKIVLYGMMTMPAYCWGYSVFGPSVIRQNNLMVGICVFTVLVSMAAWGQLMAQGHLTTFWGNNYLVLGQSIGVAAIALHVLILGHNKSWILSGGVGLLVGLLCFNGGRGPLIMTVFTLTLSYIQHYRGDYKKRIPLDSAATVAGWGGFMALQTIATNAPTTALMRTVDILRAPLNDGPVVERLTYYQQALSLFFDHPLTGVGFGLFSQSAGNADISLYPHTIFLEIGSELGLVGLMLFTAVSVPFLKNLLHSIKKPQDVLACNTGILFIALFAALNALKSGDLNDNILLFFTLGIMGYRGKTPMPPS